MSKPSILRRTLRLLPFVTIACGGLGAAQAAPPFLPNTINSSTIPANGDVNPYGVALVPQGFPSDGAIKPGDVLVANFNNSSNVQGTGTTIVQLHPDGRAAPPGTAQVFFTSIPEAAGLDTALGVARGGFVFVGNVPTKDGTFATIGQGALQVIDRNGHWVMSFTDPMLLDGPWDLALDDQGELVHVFVSNVLNGTVARLDLNISESKVKLLHKTLIGKGYPHAPNAAAVVLGPTGLAFDGSTDTLYVASTADNTIYAIANADSAAAAVERGVVVFTDPHLRGPLALRLAPNGNLLTANGDATANADPAFPSELIEFTKAGAFVRQFDVDASQGGAFGLDTSLDPNALYNFAYIDDVTNNLTLTNITQP
jgi:DNA-binding beta-propeller fold protein YncE